VCVHIDNAGTAVATMGMLSTAAYVLAMDIFGPISDNAGGIAEMSHQPAQVLIYIYTYIIMYVCMYVYIYIS
jgi:Na+/H+-translocating membrane pyrophosphatase